MKERLQRLVTFWEAQVEIRKNGSYEWHEQDSAKKMLATYKEQLAKLK